MGLAKVFGALALLGGLSNCVPLGELGVKSLPAPTYAILHNAAAIDFLRESTPIDGQLGAGLVAKSIDSDGRLAGLAVSGGGQRAAAYTLGVLAELQTIALADGTTALDRFDFISSNSGGGWGVAQYLVGRSRDGANYRLQIERDAIVEAFVNKTAGRVPCWHAAMKGILGPETFGQMYRAGRPDPLPAVFFNAALLPAQSPFVFTDAFVQRYRVKELDACKRGERVPVSNLADVPVAYAAATSGTVPMFYYAFARTRFCDPTTDDATPSFCFGKRAPDRRSYLRLADGGVYDNLGYKTAWQVMAAIRQQRQGGVPPLKGAMVLINSGTDTPHQLVTPAERNASFVTSIFGTGLFAVQDATMARLYDDMFKAIGVAQPITIDFYSTANFSVNQVDRLKGLDNLIAAANRGKCYDKQKSPSAAARTAAFREADITVDVARLVASDDCFGMNFFRYGNHAKTTYKFDRGMIMALWELGQLSVRMKRSEIEAALN